MSGFESDLSPALLVSNLILVTCFVSIRSAWLILRPQPIGNTLAFHVGHAALFTEYLSTGEKRNQLIMSLRFQKP